MQIKRILLLLHVTCMFMSGVIGVLSYFFMSRSTNGRPEDLFFIQGGVLFPAVAFFTGLASMAMRKGRSESIMLAISTVSAILLPLFI